jgi:hypothetical protein
MGLSEAVSERAFALNLPFFVAFTHQKKVIARKHIENTTTYKVTKSKQIP